MSTWAAGPTASARPSRTSLSSVGTILIWSRCEGASGLEHRLIGSAIGEAFNMDGCRYTGTALVGQRHHDREPRRASQSAASPGSSVTRSSLSTLIVTSPEPAS